MQTSTKFDILTGIEAGLEDEATVCQLRDAISKYMGGNPPESWLCESCGASGVPSQNLRLALPPKVLIVTLKRFMVLNTLPQTVWQNTKIDYSAKGLDLSEWAGPNHQDDGTASTIYNLAGVIQHLPGDSYTSASSGHYVAYSHVEQKWFKFDNAHIEEVDEDTATVSLPRPLQDTPSRLYADKAGLHAGFQIAGRTLS